MRTPHPELIDPYQDRTIYPEEERIIMLGYDFLGWSPFDTTKFKHCGDMGHNYYSAIPYARNRVEHTPDGKDITEWCTICKIYWKINLHE